MKQLPVTRTSTKGWNILSLLILLTNIFWGEEGKKLALRGHDPHDVVQEEIGASQIHKHPRVGGLT